MFDRLGLDRWLLLARLLDVDGSLHIVRLFGMSHVLVHMHLVYLHVVCVVLNRYCVVYTWCVLSRRDDFSYTRYVLSHDEIV